MKRLLRLVAAAVALLLYAWFGGVRNVGRAKARKAARRRPAGES